MWRRFVGSMDCLVFEAPYRIKSEDQVDVLAVFHGAQRLPDDSDI